MYDSYSNGLIPPSLNFVTLDVCTETSSLNWPFPTNPNITTLNDIYITFIGLNNYCFET